MINIEIKVTYKFTEERIREFLDGAGRGCGYWAEGAGELEYDSGTMLAMTNDGIKIKDLENNDKVYTLNRDVIIRGLSTMANKEPEAFSQLISNDYDVYTCDTLIQCALFGEVIYG